MAATAYHTVYGVVKDADSTARVYCCGVKGWPQHWKWLAAFAQEYADLYGTCPPLDGFHVSLEGDLDVEQQQGVLLAFRERQDVWGCWPEGRPVVVSGYGVSSGDPQGAAEYLAAMWSWLEAQPWIELHFWRASFLGEGNPNNVFESANDARLTVVGQAWQGLANSAGR